MCRYLGRAFGFVVTFPFVISFLLLYVILWVLYLLFIKLPSYCCCYVICNKNNKYIIVDNGYQTLKELTHGIPHVQNPKDAVKEAVHHLCRAKIWHYYSSYVFNNAKANKLVKIRTRFQNGNHEADIIKQQEFVTVYGGNSISQFDKLIDQTRSHDEIDEKADMEITFTNLDSLSAAIAEYKVSDVSEKITILDLASRRHVGGLGFCPYSGTQEEDLIRCSNLYWLLHPKYNQHLKSQLNEKNIDDAHIPYFGTVYLPNIVFLNNIDGKEEQKDEEYKFNIIASAAPDMRSGSNEYRSYFRKASQDQIKSVISKKIEAILATAILSQNTSILIAGAFGCGAYRCDSKLVAECFRSVINSNIYMNKGIKKIVFAIAYDDNKLNVFRETILKSKLS